MSRVPTALQPVVQPVWPAIKRAHRWGARGVGAVSRTVQGDAGREHGVPTSAAHCSRDLLGLEPGTTRYHLLADEAPARRPVPAGRPAGHWYFASVADEPQGARYVLDLDDGSLLGPHLAVVTREGRLDRETSHYFGIDGWREHPVFWNPRPGPRERFDGTLAVLAARGTGANYYHFLVDALPRLGMLAESLPDVRPDAYVLDRRTAFHEQLVAMLGLDRHRLVQPERGLALRADRLLVPSLPNHSTLVQPATVAWLRENLPPSGATGLPTRLYVSRGTARNSRRVVADEALGDALADRGFVRFDPGAHPVQEQIDHFAAAEVVVAPHGAALTNLVFSRPGVRLLELFAPGYLNGGYWSIVSGIDDSRYRYLVGAGATPRPGAPLLGLMDDVDLPVDDVMDALDELVAA